MNDDTDWIVLPTESSRIKLAWLKARIAPLEDELCEVQMEFGDSEATHPITAVYEKIIQLRDDIIAVLDPAFRDVK